MLENSMFNDTEPEPFPDGECIEPFIPENYNPDGTFSHLYSCNQIDKCMWNNKDTTLFDSWQVILFLTLAALSLFGLIFVSVTIWESSKLQSHP
jgi:hypothetical protein